MVCCRGGSWGAAAPGAHVYDEAWVAALVQVALCLFHQFADEEHGGGGAISAAGSKLGTIQGLAGHGLHSLGCRHTDSGLVMHACVCACIVQEQSVNGRVGCQ